ncbi:MAG: NAD(P)H-dependent oxidoreductase [Opitutaceae bacterium]|jgi:nitroreductase|nr:NAD(P)H-dependent oxidoreductase [Opitutaceae bacterium]
MSPVPTTQLTSALDWRYATKQFDPAKKIPGDTWAALEHALVSAPSSFGLQPWKFFVVTNPEVKAKLRPVSWNQPQVTDCSHHVVFAVRKGVNEAHVDRFLARQMALRGDTPESLAGYRGMMVGFVNNLSASGQIDTWATKQIYVALGQFMAAAALLGVDACPMEGINPAAYDDILGLTGTEFASVVACSAGYRAATDKYATAKKVRFPVSDVVAHV